MDEDALPADESEEEFRKMEQDIDEFLSSIRQNVSNSNNPQSEATCSRVINNYDSISSEDETDYHSLHSRGGKQGFSSNAKKFSSKNKQGWKKWKKKGHGVNKKRGGISRAEHHNTGGRGSKQREMPCSEDEYHQLRGQASKRRGNYQPRKFSRKEEKFHQESFSPRGSGYQRGRGYFPRRSVEYCEEEIMYSPEGTGHQEERLFSRGRRECKRSKFSPEGIGEHSQDSYIYDENISHNRTSGSKSSAVESMYHRIYAEESDSPGEWSDNQDNDYENSNPYWEQDDDPFIEDRDGHTSLPGNLNTSLLINTCLERVINFNPEIAEKFSEACMSLLNKSIDRTFDSDYEYEDNSHHSFVDQSGRVCSRSWRDSRSPSFSESFGSNSGPPGPSHYRDRYESPPQRIVVEYSQSPSPELAHDRLEEARYSGYDWNRPPAAATSQTFNTKKRSYTNHHKNDKEEDPKSSVYRSIRKIRKQCEEESNSTVRHALMALLKVHQRECDMYLRKPEAHPDYNKEYRKFLDRKSKCIIELGGDPNYYDFEQEWKKYWSEQITRLFRESWDAKMHKCTFFLQKKGHLSKSKHASSRKDVINPPTETKRKSSKGENEKVNTDEQQKLQAASTAQCKIKKEEMDAELLSILKLICHIKHRFKDCEASFDSFYQKALSLKQNNFNLCDIIEANLPLLKKLDENLRETLEDENLTLIQKAIIQETHERFKCFLKNSENINSLLIKNNDNAQDKAMEMVEAHKEVKSCYSSNTTEKRTEAYVSSATNTHEKSSVHPDKKHPIPCHVAESHPSVVTSFHTQQVPMCCDTNLQVCRPTRTLTEVSIQGSSCTASDASNKPKDETTSEGFFTSTKRQDGNQFTCKSDAISINKHSDMTQPPPPGVTPPPPGVTPPPPGVTPPPPGVTPPPANVAPPLCATLPSTASVTSPPFVPPPSHSLRSPHSRVTMPPHSVKSPPHTATLPPSSNIVTLLNTSAPSPGVTPPPPGVTPPPPEVTTPPASLASQSLTVNHSQSLQVSNVQISSDAAAKATQHPSTISTSIVASNKSLNDKDIVTIPRRRTVQRPSKELLRSTIRDCFLSTMSSSENKNDATSTAEEPLTSDNRIEENTVSSVPSLPEDILRMFVVKPEDKSEINATNKSSAKMSSLGNKVENDIKTSEKKPIKITIPQFSMRKSIPTFKPILDDQELL